MPRVNGRNDNAVDIVEQQRRGKGREGGDANRFDSASERNPSRRGDADSNAGEGSGPDGHGDPVERGETAFDFRHDPSDRRHQSFGVAALHGRGLDRQKLLLPGVENADGNGGKGGVESENPH